MRQRLFFLTAVLIGVSNAAHADEPPAIREPAIKPSERNHWAFQPQRAPNLPSVRRPNWVRTPIDAFVLARLEEKGLQPAAEAERLTLLRRVTFDLTGLPPTLEEQKAFVDDRRPDAYERVVERLLNSPHYGERWAQHWLDVVRYAESNGYELDAERPHAWRYRDYVVRSFNVDKPFARFLMEQLAGDQLPNAGPEEWIATGMHRCGPVHMVGGNTDPEESRQEVLIEMVNGVGAAFLGLSFGCARCHDHKFDPVSQADYYRLQAFFAATQYRDRDLASAADRARHAKESAAIRQKSAPIQAKITTLEAPYRAKLANAKKAALEPKYRAALAIPAEKQTAEEKKLVEHANILLKITWDEVVAALTPADRARRQAWRDEIHAIEAHLPSPLAQAWSVADAEKTPATHVLQRGNVKKKAAEVAPAFPRILADSFGPKRAPRTRLELAQWLAGPDHPLTARVWVNRVWQHHFGRGLVRTPNDFGLRGEKPTHPELLDWLATEFARHGWSNKHLHRLLVLSATYRQTSTVSPHVADPENLFLSRMNRQRLEGEALRDAILAAAGTLNRTIGGPMIFVPLEPAVYDLIFTEGEPDGLWQVTPDVRQHTRRTLYLFAKRNVRQPMLEAFDQPDTLNSCPNRPTSTFAPQALIMMNGPLAQAQSKAFAAHLLRAVGTNESALIDLAWRRTLGRAPRPGELGAGTTFLRMQTTLLQDRLANRRPVGIPRDIPPQVDPALAAALADFCLALFNLSEFAYVD